MARVLRRTVVSGGVTYPAGTKENAELKKAISNAAAWEGEADKPAASKSDKSDSKSDK